MGGSSNTGQYKSWKEMPLWLKVVVIGPFALVLFGILLSLIPLENKKFDAQIEQKTERIHAQIAEGKFREVFIEGDRELIASYDENEFAAKLAPAQKYFAGKHQKTGVGKTTHVDTFSRLKYFFGRPALVVSHYSFRSDAGSGDEGFFWIIRGDEVKLADYGLSIKN